MLTLKAAGYVDVDKGDKLTVQHWNGSAWQDVRTITTTQRRWVATEPVKTRFVYTKAGQYNGRGVYVHARGDAGRTFAMAAWVEQRSPRWS